MADEPLPQATAIPPKRSRISVIWIIPILAAIVAMGIAIQRILSEGPTITILFSAVEGLEAGKTFIKYKDVNIGQVKAMRLTDDYTKVEVTAKIEKHAANLMVQDAKFWIVRPQITLSGVSGLSTLLSGNYIGFEPGSSEQSESARSFTGLDVAPVVPGEPGREFILNSVDLASLSVGSPIYYRRLQVGQVTGYELQRDGKSVQIKIFVKAPYDRFVTTSTRFWNVSGVDVSVGADGVNVRTESLVASLVGGLAFETPSFAAQDSAAAAPNTAFTLYSDRVVAMKAPDKLSEYYVLHFHESLHGLSVGAPVTFLGLTAGEVTHVGLVLDESRGNIRTEVMVVIYPEREVAFGTGANAQAGAALIRDEKRRRALLKRLVEERGLRAQLKSGSLVTGQLYVSLDYHPEAPRVAIDLTRDPPEMPVVPSALAELQDKLGSVVGKIDRMPLEAIGNDVKKNLENLDRTLTSANRLLTHTDEQLVPGLKTDIEDLHRSINAVEQAVSNANASLLQSDAPAQAELREALQEFNQAARSLRVLLDELERQPSSVIRGKPEGTSGGR
jgi:paraquat-inducible protein B